MCDDVPVNISQRATVKGGQLSVLEHREDPGVLGTWKRSSNVSQKDTRVLWSTRDVGSSSGLNLQDIVRHLLGEDASLRRMYASHGVPMKASADGRNKEFAIAVAQC